MPDKDQKQAQFIASRKQLHRMAAIVAMLKEKDLVKMQEIRKRLDRTEFELGAYMGCVNRTIQRDIRVLKDEYFAPIEYDRHEAAYRLTDPKWTFQVPALLNPDQLLAVVIGGKLSQDIFPEEISRRVTSAVDEIIRYNESSELTGDLLKSLKILTGDNSKTREEVFKMVFDAWSKRRVLTISYTDLNGNSTVRDIEPHALVFYDMRWSIKGLCRLRGEWRTFHLAQIQAAAILDETFAPATDTIENITSDTFWNYKSISDISIRLNDAGRMYAIANPLHSGQNFVQDEDGSYLMTVPAAPLERLVPWILNQQGNASPETPSSFVDAVRKAILRLADACQAYDPAEIRQKTRKASAKFNRKT